MNPGSHAPSSTSSSPSSRRDPGVTLDPRAVSSRSRSHHPNTNSPNSRKKFAASSIEVVGPPLKTGCCSIIQTYIFFLLTTPGETGGRNFPKDDITQRPSPNIYVLPSVPRAFVRQLHLQKAFQAIVIVIAKPSNAGTSNGSTYLSTTTTTVPNNTELIQTTCLKNP